MAEKRDYYISFRQDIRLRRWTRPISITIDASRLSSLFYAIPEASRRPKETPGWGCISVKLSDRRRVREPPILALSLYLALSRSAERGRFRSPPPLLFHFFFRCSLALQETYRVSFFDVFFPSHAGFHQRLSFSPRRRVDESKSD